MSDKHTYSYDAPPPQYLSDDHYNAYRSSSRQPSPQPQPQPQSSPVPSSSSPRAGGGFLQGLSGSEMSDFLNPPPPSFSRAPRRELPYSPFPPLTALSAGGTLEKGFAPLPPPSAVQPHPFATHDVCEDDWVRFIGDIQKVGKLSPMNKIVANVAPITMHVGVAGFFITRAIENGMRRRKIAPVTQLIEHWNHYFFWPRGMQVDLTHGRYVYSARDEISPELTRGGYVPSAADDDSDSDSDSDDDARDRRSARPPSADNRREGRTRSEERRDKRREKRARSEEKKQAKRERSRERKARKDEKRARKRERQDRKKGEKDLKHEPWKLVITYKAPAY
ncbi:hypothetical protein PsYK624_098430 [Phanerochaete sordida]|uniref:Uncharacterized protein n=1 Tax=Phanerochaete sordida TaxID=48140 RepID=A0A9P3GF03_9APHY|nr:hypothetical protein PsYK624_098430 [Phanerochaete sordida]